MFTIKTRARVLTHGLKLRATLFALLPAAAAAGFAVSALLSALCFVYGAGNVLGGYYCASRLLALPRVTALLPWALALSAALFAVFFCGLRFALKGMFYAGTQNARRPAKSLISPRTGVRLLWCGGLLVLRRLGWLALTFSPGLLTFFAGWLLLARFGLPPGLFWLWVGLTCGQLAAGAGAAWVLCGRYALTNYVLYLHPLIPVREAVRSGVLLTRGKLAFTARCRLCELPWRALMLFGASRPFAFTYVNAIEAVLCETLYGAEKKF